MSENAKARKEIFSTAVRELRQKVAAKECSPREAKALRETLVKEYRDAT